jgi:transcriptional regulator with XRE-family HTH domain
MFWERFYQLCEKNETKPNPLGKSLGISSGVLTKWKSGSIPNGDSLIKIADRLNCSVDYLLGRTDMVNYTDYGVADDNDFVGIIIEKSHELNNEGHTELLRYTDYLLSKDEYVKSRQDGAAI